MRMPPKKYLVGAAVLALLGASAAEAAATQLHTIQVDAPDGSVVHVQYTGDVAPRVQFVPADAAQQADVPVMADPFAHMERISAMMDAQMNAMMQRAAMMQQQAAQMQQHAVAASADGSAPARMPEGVQVSYYSSSTDASGCTRSTSYSSDGSGAAPKVTQAASDGCDAVKPQTQAIPAKAEAPVEQAPPPGRKV